MTLDELYEETDRSNITVFHYHFVDCIAISSPDGYIGMDVDKIENSAEEKVYLAHEMGHYSTGSYYNIYSPLDIRKKHETRADRWAIKKLVPFEELSKVVASGMYGYCELAEYFNVPYSFMQKAIEYYEVIGGTLQSFLNNNCKYIVVSMCDYE